MIYFNVSVNIFCLILSTERSKMGYIQSFNRRETKYLLTSEQAEAFLREAHGLLSRDKYGEYTICNLYLDTDDFYFIEHSLNLKVALPT